MKWLRLAVELVPRLIRAVRRERRRRGVSDTEGRKRDNRERADDWETLR